jgi:hypothetical protein
MYDGFLMTALFTAVLLVNKSTFLLCVLAALYICSFYSRLPFANAAVASSLNPLVCWL